MKKIIILISVLTLTLLLTTGCGTKSVKNDETIVDGNENVLEEKVVDGITFTNILFTRESEQSVYVTQVTNNTDKVVTMSTFNIILKDKDGNTVYTLSGYVGGDIQVSQAKVISNTIDMDLSNVTSAEYVIN